MAASSEAALKQTVEAFLQQHEVTNPDRVTFERHVACLVDRLKQECDEYLESVWADAANEPSDEEKFLGSPAYYRTSSLL